MSPCMHSNLETVVKGVGDISDDVWIVDTGVVVSVDKERDFRSRIVLCDLIDNIAHPVVWTVVECQSHGLACLARVDDLCR